MVPTVLLPRRPPPPARKDLNRPTELVEVSPPGPCDVPKDLPQKSISRPHSKPWPHETLVAEPLSAPPPWCDITVTSALGLMDCHASRERLTVHSKQKHVLAKTISSSFH